MKYENKSGGYGMRGDWQQVEDARVACPVCALPVAHEHGEHDRIDPCPHLRFYCVGRRGRFRMKYFGDWDTSGFEREWIRRFEWRKTGAGPRALLVDPVESARELDEFGEPISNADEDGRDPAQERRFRKAIKDWTFPGLTLVRRADPLGGCIVGSELPFTLMGFNTGSSKAKSKSGVGIR